EPAPLSTLTDTSLADFGAGTFSNTYLADESGGEVILAPTVGAEFAGSTLPAGWTQNPNPWATGGTVSVSSGQMALEARSVATNATFGPGTSLEFVATFGAQPHQHFGFINGVDFNSPWIVVSTGTGGNGVFARSDSNQTGVSLGAGLLGSAHRYRVKWTATAFEFYVDGGTVPVATLS